MRLAADLDLFCANAAYVIQELKAHRIAYATLTRALDRLAEREPYKALVEDLRTAIEEERQAK